MSLFSSTPKRRRRRPTRTKPTASRSQRLQAAAPPGTSRVARRSRRSTSAKHRVGGSLPRTRSTPITRRSVLAVLLVAAFALVTLSYRGGVGVHKAQLRVLDVFAPIERGLNAAWDPVAGAWSWGGRLFTAMGDAPELREENAELRTALRVAHAREDEDKDLRRILQVGEQGVYPGGYEPVVGRIIARGSSSVDRTVTLNVGSDRGIAVNDAVMTAEGLAGIVTGVSPSTATVGLILDSTNQPTATIVGSDGAGGTGILETVTSDGQPAMRIEKVRQSAKVEKGDEVFTAGFADGTGLRSRYPAGIPIGQVRSAVNGAANEYQTIQVDPYTDFEDLRFLFVLVATTDDSALDVEPEQPEPRANLSDTVSDAVAQPITSAEARAKAAALARAAAARKRAAAAAKKEKAAGAAGADEDAASSAAGADKPTAAGATP